MGFCLSVSVVVMKPLWNPLEANTMIRRIDIDVRLRRDDLTQMSMFDQRDDLTDDS